MAVLLPFLSKYRYLIHTSCEIRGSPPKYLMSGPPARSVSPQRRVATNCISQRYRYPNPYLGRDWGSKVSMLQSIFGTRLGAKSIDSQFMLRAKLEGQRRPRYKPYRPSTEYRGRNSYLKQRLRAKSIDSQSIRSTSGEVREATKAPLQTVSAKYRCPNSYLGRDWGPRVSIPQSIPRTRLGGNEDSVTAVIPWATTLKYKV